MIAAFPDLGNACGFTVSSAYDRWFFHTSGPSGLAPAAAAGEGLAWSCAGTTSVECLGRGSGDPGCQATL